jgi:hypothetical protein
MAGETEAPLEAFSQICHTYPLLSKLAEYSAQVVPK